MLINHRVVAYATAAVILSSFALSGRAQAYQCKTGFTQAESISTPKFKARMSAKKFWATAVKNKYGLQWSSWDIAASKSVNCGWTGTKFYCIAKAKPCLYVVP